MQVVEVITKKMLKGEDISYVLQAGSEKTSRVTLDQVDGEVFDSAEKARKVLTHRATTQVNKLVDFALTKAKEWYDVDAHDNPSSAQTIKDLPDLMAPARHSLPVKEEEVVYEDEEIIPEAPTVRLPDGTLVKVKMPQIA
mgnify:FL=1